MTGDTEARPGSLPELIQMSEQEPLTALDCPLPDCDRRFHNHHDEHCTTSLVYHLKQEHMDVWAFLSRKMEVGGLER